MTDSEIKKALEFLRGTEIANFIIKNTLDLINRLQAENERLKKFLDMSRKVSLARRDRNLKICELNQKILEELKTAKAEAYKEFAELVKDKAYTYSDITGYQSTVVDVCEIDGVYEEMVGDTDA